MKFKQLFSFLLVLAFVFSIVGCDRHYTKKTKQPVHVYKKHNPHYVANAAADAAEDVADEWIYYYVMFYNNNYYSYSSYSPIYSTPATWASSKTPPVNEQEVEQVEEVSVPNEEFGQEIDSAIEANETSMAESAGYDNSSSDNASSDAGESSSGGDSGGGDGGGGSD